MPRRRLGRGPNGSFAKKPRGGEDTAVGLAPRAWHADEDVVLERLGDQVGSEAGAGSWEDVAQAVSAVVGGGTHTWDACRQRFHGLRAAAPHLATSIHRLVGVELPVGHAVRAALATGRTRRFKAEDLHDLRFEVAWRGVAPQQDGFNEHGHKPLSEKDLGLLQQEVERAARHQGLPIGEPRPLPAASERIAVAFAVARGRTKKRVHQLCCGTVLVDGSVQPDDGLDECWMVDYLARVDAAMARSSAGMGAGGSPDPSALAPGTAGVLVLLRCFFVGSPGAGPLAGFLDLAAVESWVGASVDATSEVWPQVAGVGPKPTPVSEGSRPPATTPTSH